MLGVEAQGGTVKMSVSDNGVGMSATTIEHAFDLFSQAERSSDRTQGGLGIGLALVKNLVNLHRGSVDIYSGGAGKGTCVTITLPRLEQAAAPRAGAEETSTSGSPDRPLKIMVVDDNDDATQALALLLTDKGHHVLVEHSPSAALKRARSETPDVLLLDIGLPEIDGHELARRIRRQEENAGALLVALTGYGQDQDRREAYAAGFDHFLVKPASMQELTELLNRRHGKGATDTTRRPD